MLKALGEALPSGPLYGQGVQRLRRWCRTSERLPSSYTLADTVELTSNHAFSSTGLSNVYEGRCQEAKVAVKEPRLHVDDVKAVQKVRPFLNDSFISCRVIPAGLQERDRDVEVPSTSQHSPIPRHFEPLSGLCSQQMDAGWDHIDFPAGAPGGESFEIRTHAQLLR
jgi:hypothetical protein